MPEETRRQPLLTLEEVAQQAQEVILRYGSHTPTLIAEGHLSSAFTQMQRLAETHEGRKAQMFLRGLMLAESGEVGILQQVFFISEAWMSKATKEDIPFVPPSRDPQRREIVIVAHHVIQPLKQDGVVYGVKRNSKGRVTRLELIEFLEEEDEPVYDSPLMEAFIAGFLGLGMMTND